MKFTPRFAPTDPGFREFILLTLPLMLGVGLVTVDEWLLKYFASSHEHGSIAWLNNSRKLMLVVFALIGQAAGQAALPFLTQLHHEGKAREMAEMLATSVGRVVFLALIGASALAVSAEASVQLVFRRGAFTAHDASMTATLLTCFCIGLGAWAAQTMAVRGFYARKDTLTPMLVATLVVLLVLPVYFELNEQFGVVGLALASSIGMTINAVLTIAVYRFRTGNLPLRPILSGLWRGLVVAGVCGALAWWGGSAYSEWMTPSGFVDYLGMFLTQAVAFAVPLGVLAWFWGPPELEFAMERIRRRLRR